MMRFVPHRILRQLNRATPILAMTDSLFDTDRPVCLAAGMNDTMIKPVEPERLYETLLKGLGGEK